MLSDGGNEGRNDKKGVGKLARDYLKSVKCFQVASWLGWRLPENRLCCFSEEGWGIDG